MINVVLCDDNPLFLMKLEQRLALYDCAIYKYTSVKEVLGSQIIFDIAFIDIDLGNNECGFNTIEHLRKNNPKCIVAFFTNYKDYAIDGYEYQAFRYILKNDPEVIIQKKISDVFNEFYRNNKLITGAYKDQKFALTPSEIYYVETFRHVLTIHSSKGVFEAYKNISDFCEELSHFGFFRCHRSYVVNIQYISSIKSDNFFLLNTPQNDLVPIGIRYKNESKRIFLETRYIGGLT